MNVGATPAYKVRGWSNIIFASQFSQDSLNAVPPKGEHRGFIVGANRRLSGPFTANFLGGQKWTAEDSSYFMRGENPLLLIIKITYEDASGKPHYTQEGFIRPVHPPHWFGVITYERTDYDDQPEPNK
jgi:hypothetical protein